MSEDKISITGERISAKKAAQIAADYYKDVTDDYNGVGLEEIELSKDGKHWLITISHRDKIKAGFYEDNLAYKAFDVDAFTGAVLAMKIKKI
jgi:hypothetical protein